MSEELKAVNHHRNVLRDTVEEVEKRLRETTDDKSERLFDQSRRADRVRSSIDAISDGDIESLKRQIARYKARASAMDELAGIYRTSVLALYADGASYGAAQFGWQPHGRPQEFPTKGIHLIGVGWIEREMATVKHSFEDEIRSLDSEVNDLKSKLKQANSFNAELRRRFEENMKSNYR